MSLNLEKGQNLNLAKEAPGLKKVVVGLGWTAPENASHEYDLDGTVLVLRENSAEVNTADVCYFGQLTILDGAIHHNGDNLTGAGDGDDEVIDINLEKLPSDVSVVGLVVNIYQAVARGNQNFGQVKNAFVRLLNGDTNEEIARFDLTEDASTSTAMEFGRLYRHNGDWKFKAMGIGSKDADLNEVRRNFKA